jgi:hypothetical protein
LFRDRGSNEILHAKVGSGIRLQGQNDADADAADRCGSGRPNRRLLLRRRATQALQDAGFSSMDRSLWSHPDQGSPLAFDGAAIALQPTGRAKFAIQSDIYSGPFVAAIRSEETAIRLLLIEPGLLRTDVRLLQTDVRLLGTEPGLPWTDVGLLRSDVRFLRTNIGSR